jgi:hypothetical protein
MGAKLIGRHNFISFISGNEVEKAGKELSFGQGLDDGNTSQKAAEDSVIVVCTPAAEGQRVQVLICPCSCGAFHWRKHCHGPKITGQRGVGLTSDFGDLGDFKFLGNSAVSRTARPKRCPEPG